jgi:hypothetical protein
MRSVIWTSKSQRGQHQLQPTPYSCRIFGQSGSYLNDSAWAYLNANKYIIPMLLLFMKLGGSRAFKRLGYVSFSRRLETCRSLVSVSSRKKWSSSRVSEQNVSVSSRSRFETSREHPWFSVLYFPRFYDGIA